jgi:predicted nucleic acid-binding protein
MKACFVDTNLFIRYLTNDDPDKANKVEDLSAPV